MGFHVQKSSISGGPYTVLAAIMGTSTTSYVDMTVTAGQTNYYVITAFNSGGDSDRSNEVAAATPAQAPNWTISGSVQVANATVKLSGSSFASLKSGLAGAYTFSLQPGSYTVTPSKWRCNFTPASVTVNLIDAPIVLNFQATGRKCRQQ